MARFDEEISEVSEKMINSIRENLFEKIGRDEWIKKPVDTHGHSPWHFSKQFKLRLT